MKKELIFNKRKIEKLIKEVFPNSGIERYRRFTTGIVDSSFKVHIKNPKKIIVVKLTRLKRKDNSHKNNLILNYLNSRSIPSPKVFFEGIRDRKFITIMEFVPGEVGTKLYSKANNALRKNILRSAGKNLRKIHNLKIPNFWKHQKHEIKNKEQWKNWTKLRIDKYLKFFKRKYGGYDLLEKELIDFWAILKNDKIDFVPLHWDFHLSNVNVNKKGVVTGIFDFDNAMKGHNLSDIGQSLYWNVFLLDDYKNFSSFLKGYKNNYSKKELNLIHGYFLLHLLAVTRTIWFRKKRLGWIIEKHKKILDDYLNGKFKMEKSVRSLI